jgi:DNA-binding CsgD family transcriptional regulator
MAQTEVLTEDFSPNGESAAALLLERGKELARLDAVLGRVRRGRGRVMLVEGPAGIGKTRLLEETCERAHAGGTEVLCARGGEFERDYGLGVVRQLFERTLTCASADRRRELLSGAAMLAEPVSARSPSAAGDTPETVLHGLYWLAANLADRAPLLLAIDDAHWVDGPSLRFLLYLARRIEATPVAVVTTIRTGQAGSEPELLRALRLEVRTPVLQPSALSLQAAGTLARAHLGRDISEGFARACHDATRGNPFLLIELLHQLRSSGDDRDPQTVVRLASNRAAASILQRIERAGEGAAALARAISVLGEHGDLDVAAGIAGIRRFAADAVADALVDADVLEPQTRAPPRFVHPLVRSAVYEAMSGSQRARLHARAASLLAGLRGGVEAAAVHLLRTEPAADEAAVELLRRAARTAIARGAPETAVEFLRRAEREPPADRLRPALLHELGTAAWRAGQADGVEALREAFRLSAAQPARARVGLDLANAIGVSSSTSSEAIAVLERALDGLGDDELRAMIDARLAMIAGCLPAVRARLDARMRRIHAATIPQTDTGLALLATLAADLALTGATTVEAVRLAERALDDGRLMRRDIATEFDFAMAAVWVLVHAGHLLMAKRHLDDAMTFVRGRGSAFAGARIACVRALVSWLLGDLQAAESDAESALGVQAAWGIPHTISTAVIAAVRTERGDLQGAREVLATLDSDPAILEVTPSQVVREVRAALALAEGRPQEALAELSTYARWEQQAGLGRGVVPFAWRTPAALAHLQLGRVDDARQLATTEVELARGVGAGPRLGAALRAYALVNDAADATALLEEAAEVLERSGACLEHARTLVDLGAALRARGRRAAAIERLRLARDEAHRCGATSLVDAAAVELRRAGSRPRRIALTGPQSLTPSERRVTELAAQGMSNRQIAQALFVTLRTVELHLSHSYRKLGISSREQLGGALGAD